MVVNKSGSDSVSGVEGTPSLNTGGGSLTGNVSARDFWWTDPLHPADGNPGTLELMDASDLAWFKARGGKGVVTKFPYTSFYGLGSDQLFPPNPIGMDLSAAQYRDARALRDVVMPKLAAAGVGAVAVVDLKNRVPSHSSFILNSIFPPANVPGGIPGTTWDNDSSPSTSQKVGDWAAFCRAVGFEGLMFDGENYPDNGGVSGSIWGGQENVDAWQQRGREIGIAIATAWPDVCLMAYHNFLPGSYDEIERGEVFTPNGSGPGTGYSQANFYYGVTDGMATAAPNGNWCLHFMEATHFRGPQPVGYRQQDVCGTAAWFSRNWPHWWKVLDRIAVEPFIWLNDGPGSITEDISYNPGQLAADKTNLRNWHVVTKGDRQIRQHFVYDAELQLPLQTLDCNPYNFPSDHQASLDFLGTATTVANNAPTLNITAPVNGSSTGASSVTVVSGDTSDDFGVVGVWWENDAWAVGHPNRKGHVAMTFNKISGSLTTSFTWRHDLSLQAAGQPAGPIPLAMGVNNITFTARDSKGATTAVVKTVTRV